MARFIMYVMAAFLAAISIPLYASTTISEFTASNNTRYKLGEPGIQYLRPGEKVTVSDGWCEKPVYAHWFHFDITCTSARVLEATKDSLSETSLSETGGITTTETRLRIETVGGVVAMIAMLLAVAFAASFTRQTTKLGVNIIGIFFTLSVLIATAGGAISIMRYGMSWTLILAPAVFIAGMAVFMSVDVDGMKPNIKVFYLAAAIFEVLMASFLILVW